MKQAITGIHSHLLALVSLPEPYSVPFVNWRFSIALKEMTPLSLNVRVVLTSFCDGSDRDVAEISV